ncbi:hypothetical protein [Pseudoglutamicibacter albus]|uniref:hypothetical protein n=1 Tax=Pseudoglutamicibacter albus TaxID=98671 RepID=UPI00361C014F
MAKTPANTAPAAAATATKGKPFAPVKMEPKAQQAAMKIFSPVEYSISFSTSTLGLVHLTTSETKTKALLGSGNGLGFNT